MFRKVQTRFNTMVRLKLSFFSAVGSWLENLKEMARNANFIRRRSFETGAQQKDSEKSLAAVQLLTQNLTRQMASLSSITSLLLPLSPAMNRRGPNMSKRSINFEENKTTYGYGTGYVYGYVYGDGNGYGDGTGYVYGKGSGDGKGDGYDYGTGYVYGKGSGDGYDYGTGYGDGNGTGW
jgi:hypothetical protein